MGKERETHEGRETTNTVNIFRFEMNAKPNQILLFEFASVMERTRPTCTL